MVREPARRGRWSHDRDHRHDTESPALRSAVRPRRHQRHRHGRGTPTTSRTTAQLRRSRSDRKVAGVAGGLGRHLNIDPTILRVLFVVLAFFGGAGPPAVRRAVAARPRGGHRGRGRSAPTTDPQRAADRRRWCSPALVAIGDTWNGYGFPWPLAVVGLVVAVVLLAVTARTPRRRPPARCRRPRRRAPRRCHRRRTHPATPRRWHGRRRAAPPAATRPPPPCVPPGPPAAARPPRVPARCSSASRWPWSPSALGVLGLYDASGADVEDAAYPALALAIIGADARGRRLLRPPRRADPPGAGRLAASLGGAAIGNPTFDGERDLWCSPTGARPTSRTRYDVPAGRIVLDLTEIEDLERARRPDASSSRPTSARSSSIVPEDVTVDFDAPHRLRRRDRDPRRRPRRVEPDASPASSATDDAGRGIDLELDLHFGQDRR